VKSGGKPATPSENKKFRPCRLDGETQKLVKMIFDTDMFRDAMVEMDIGQ